MKSTVDRFAWGLILIVAGGVFTAHNLGYQIDLTPTAGMAVAVGLSGLNFIRYFVGDHTHWERLMPACLLAAIAVMISLSEAHAPDSIVAMPLFIGIALPFAVALGNEPQKNRWAAVPLAVFSCLALMALFNTTGFEAGPLALIIVGIIALINSLRPRRASVS